VTRHIGFCTVPTNLTSGSFLEVTYLEAFLPRPSGFPARTSGQQGVFLFFPSTYPGAFLLLLPSLVGFNVSTQGFGIRRRGTSFLGFLFSQALPSAGLARGDYSPFQFSVWDPPKLPLRSTPSFLLGSRFFSTPPDPSLHSDLQKVA